MKNHNSPVHPLPWLYSPYQEMTDEEVDAVHDFLLELANAFGNRYASQLHRIARKKEKALRLARKDP
jgi:hypothetical protein